MLGVLKMPPECRGDDQISVAQRHSIYKEAADEIESLRAKLAEANEFIEAVSAQCESVEKQLEKAHQQLADLAEDDQAKAVRIRELEAQSGENRTSDFGSTLENGLQVLCKAMGVSTERYDTDQSDIECCMDCFKDAADLIQQSGFAWDDDEGLFKQNGEAVAWMDQDGCLHTTLNSAEFSGRPATPLYISPPDAKVPEGSISVPIELIEEYIELLQGVKYKPIHSRIRVDMCKTMLAAQGEK